MRGVQFVVNEDGEKTAVILDLQEWGELWEDFYDLLVARSRANEECISWTDLEAELAQEISRHDTMLN